MIPRSFANGTGEISLPRCDTWKSSGILLTICRDPSMRNVVLSGFIRRLLAQHHILLAILLKCAVRRALTPSASLTENNRYSFESSTYDSREHISGIEGRSFMYKPNNAGQRMEPCGTPCVVIRVSENCDPAKRTD